MLNVIGVGSAFPEAIIHNDWLLKIRKTNDFSREFPGAKIKARRTCLPLHYIEETGNQDNFKVIDVVTATPTDLGVEAAKDALSGAGLLPEQLGLIIGDSATPYATTPAEAQRITGGLGLKGVSYEISSSGCSLAVQLSNLMQWKDDRIPDYVLCVSSNTVTNSVNYAEGEEAAYFGDAASAFIVSTRMPGKMKVIAAASQTFPALPDFLTVDLYGHIKVGTRPSEDSIRSWVDLMLTELSSKQVQPARDEIKVILPPFYEDSIGTMLCERGFREENFWTNSEFFGDSLSAYSGSVLSGHWDEINSHSQALIVQIGAGVSFGYVFLAV